MPILCAPSGITGHIGPARVYVSRRYSAAPYPLYSSPAAYASQSPPGGNPPHKVGAPLGAAGNRSSYRCRNFLRRRSGSHHELNSM